MILTAGSCRPVDYSPTCVQVGHESNLCCKLSMLVGGTSSHVEMNGGFSLYLDSRRYFLLREVKLVGFTLHFTRLCPVSFPHSRCDQRLDEARREAVSLPPSGGSR